MVHHRMSIAIMIDDVEDDVSILNISWGLWGHQEGK